jgi:AraC-like DNA-binding protein
MAWESIVGYVHCVSTAAVPEAERMAFWTGGARKVQSIGDIRAVPLTSPFEAEAATRRLGPLLVFGLEASPHKVLQHCKRDQAVLKLRYQCSGECVIEQRGERRTLGPGEWTVIDGSLPHVMTITKHARQISLHLPRNRLMARDIEAANAIFSIVATDRNVGKLLIDCLRYSLEELGETGETTEANLGMSLLEMFRATISEASSEREALNSRETLELRVRNYVSNHLGDPGLSINSIAKAMGCSGRYLHKAFEGQESLTRMIWSQRLERCRLELLSTGGRQLTLTELAYRFGFSSSAHFSRMFKDRYGTTPSDLRREAMTGAPPAS